VLGHEGLQVRLGEVLELVIRKEQYLASLAAPDYLPYLRHTHARDVPIRS
jgi:hypothetical protein